MTADPRIETLEAKGLIKLAAYRPELEYLFRHWLVQDAAYGSLLKQERRQLHRLVGEALESLYPDRQSELAGILAMHFEQAGDSAKAVDYYVADGRYAADRNAIREAFTAFDRALSLLPAPSPDEPREALRRRVEVVVLRTKAGWTFRPFEEVARELDSIIPDAVRLGDLELEAEAHTHLALVRIQSGETAVDPMLERSLARLSAIGALLDDPTLGALPIALTAMHKVSTGPVREGVEALELAIPLIEQRRDVIGAAFARGWLAVGYARLGEFDRAAAAIRAAKDQAAQGDLIAQLDAQISEAMIHSASGDLEAAAPLAQACVLRAEETGATACAVASAFVLGDVYQRQGRYGAARDALQLGLDLAPGNDPGMFGPMFQAWLRVDPETPVDPDDPSWDALVVGQRDAGNHLGEAGMLAKRGEAAARRERWDTALRDYEASATIFEQQGARPDLARALRGWGEALRAVGRSDEATAVLGRAQALFEEMGLEREAADLRAAVGGRGG